MIKRSLLPAQAPSSLRLLAALVLLAASAAADPAQSPPPPKPPEPSPELAQALLEPFGSPIDRGRLRYDARLRYEHADQVGLADADALTFRQRFGYETPLIEGFRLLAEGEYNWVLNSGDFAPYPPPFNAGRTVVADGETFDLNQLFLGYESDAFGLKLGRQVVNLDNQRFVGAVGWRQNDQSFDAVRATLRPVEGLEISYLWNWQGNRIFGSQAPALALRRFHADSHFLNLAYKGLPELTLAAYGYAIRLRNASALSSDTVGLYADGSRPLGGGRSLLYRVEFAYQTDNGDTEGPGFGETYLHLRLGLKQGDAQGGFAFESLGGDGIRSLNTPLATLHGFNGWTDTFLSTPADGLRDYSLWLAGPLPGGLEARVEGRIYTAQDNGQKYGDEIGLMLKRKLGDRLVALLKGSFYSGRADAPGPAAASKEKVWLQLDYKL